MKRWLANMHLILTLKCEDSSRLVSAGFDRQLSWSEWLAMRLHVSICRSCRRFRRQVTMLQQAIRSRFESEAATEKLSTEGKQRILDGVRAKLR